MKVQAEVSTGGKVWFVVNREKVFKTLSGLKDEVVRPLKKQTQNWKSVPFGIEEGTISGKEGDTFYVESPSLPSNNYLWEVDGIDVFPHTAEGKSRAGALTKKLTKEFQKKSSQGEVPKKVLKKSSQGDLPKKVLKKSSQGDLPKKLTKEFQKKIPKKILKK